jgi:hypothetical protein
MSTTGGQHLSWPNLLEYLTAGAPAIVRIAGTPNVDLVIEPTDQRIAIRGPWPGTGDVPDLGAYRHLDTRVGTDASGDWVEFAVSGRGILQEAYPVLTAVADRVQLHGDGMGAAIAGVLDSYRRLLSSLGRLSEQQELGLYGELLVLNHLVRSVGEGKAVASWRGPMREEHDFGLDSFDIEVKTTLSEDRSHRISSLTQLEPSPERDLWLVSIQVTTYGVGGTTLPKSIETTTDAIRNLTDRSFLAERLADAGWDPAHGHLYTRRFTLRSEILTFRITSEFPAITAPHLQSAGLPIERFSHVSYILSTSGLVPDPPPTELQQLGAS